MHSIYARATVQQTKAKINRAQWYEAIRNEMARFSKDAGST